MDLGFLKKIRIVVSLLFFLLTLLLFIDLHNYFYKIADPVLFLQFVPSLLDTLILFTASGIGFIIISLVALLFGRVYCSSVCPLGTLQDIVTWTSRKMKSRKVRRKFHHFSMPHNNLRYGILLLVFITSLSGFYFFLDLSDPYSNFGRISTTFMKPVVIFLNNSVALLLSKFNSYAVLPVVYREVNPTQIVFPLAMILLIGWLAYRYGRLYCNSVCPVGTLLGILSRFSLFKLRINPQACNNCGKCVYDCKASCIDRENKEIDFSRCVACYNCFDACSTHAIFFQNSITKNVPEIIPKIRKVDLKKRSFVSKAFLFLTTASGARALSDTLTIKHNVIAKSPSKIPLNKQWLVLPPGSLDIKHFTEYCTACTLCVSACPNNVLQPSFLQFGIEGMMQPYMDYSSGFCNYDCKICGDICPTNAITNIATIEEKKTIQMGKVKFIKENCVVYTDRTDCGACSEHCPTKAVNMVPFENTGLFIPEVDDTICVGCGACEHPCPVRPFKAIYVEGNPVQLVAQKPKEEKLEKSKLKEDEFPF